MEHAIEQAMDHAMEQASNAAIVGRFAPSPTGRMHLGNLWSALLCDLYVRGMGGTLILRIEDIDRARCRAEYTRRLIEDLKRFGFAFDEGYGGVGGPRGPYLQSERTHLYEHALSELRARGLCYPCYCSRAERMASSAPHASDGRHIYAGTCRGAPERPGVAHAVRLRVEPGEAKFRDLLQGEQSMDVAENFGDLLVRRADGAFAYQLACALDDALMGVTLVVRGADLLSSSFPQMHIMRLLGHTPPRYCHVPLLVDGEGVRLSKRQQAMDVGELLARESPQRILGRLAVLAGQMERAEEVTLQELEGIFRPERMPRAPEIRVCAEGGIWT